MKHDQNLISIYSVFDDKVGAYLQPFFARNDAVALRQFQSAAMDTSSQFNKFAADYTLFYIGQFDENNGFLNRTTTPKNLGTALHAISQVNNQHAEETK